MSNNIFIICLFCIFFAFKGINLIVKATFPIFFSYIAVGLKLD